PHKQLVAQCIGIFIGSVVGVLLGTLDSLLPRRAAGWLPSTAALGLAFILPALIAMMMGLGAVITWPVNCRWPSVT
ncbi:hypothetical protein PpSQ1_26415, partial [Pseudomonas putida]